MLYYVGDLPFFSTTLFFIKQHKNSNLFAMVPICHEFQVPARKTNLSWVSSTIFATVHVHKRWLIKHMAKCEKKVPVLEFDYFVAELIGRDRQNATSPDTLPNDSCHKTTIYSHLFETVYQWVSIKLLLFSIILSDFYQDVLFYLLIHSVACIILKQLWV